MKIFVTSLTLSVFTMTAELGLKPAASTKLIFDWGFLTADEAIEARLNPSL